MFYLNRIKDVNIDVIQNYLGVIELYNASFHIPNLRCSYSIDIIKKSNKSYKDIVKEYFGLSGDEDITFELIELNDWKIAVNNWLVQYSYEAIRNMIYNLDKDSNIRCIIDEMTYYLKDAEENYNQVKCLNYDSTQENILSKTFVNLLDKYINGDVSKVFCLQSNPDFFYECFWDDILIECSDKFIVLHFGVSD